MFVYTNETIYIYDDIGYRYIHVSNPLLLDLLFLVSLERLQESLVVFSLSPTMATLSMGCSKRKGLSVGAQRPLCFPPKRW